jgi:hypothetical protein
VESFLTPERPAGDEQERVLDIPAIDMTGGAGAPPGERGHPPVDQAPVTPRARRRAAAGGMQDIVDAVEALADAARRQQRELDELRNRYETLRRAAGG